VFDIQDFHLSSQLSPLMAFNDFSLAEYFQNDIFKSKKKRRFKNNSTIFYHSKIMKVLALQMKLNWHKHVEVCNLTPRRLKFTFNFEKLGFYVKAPPYCRTCSSPGHFPSECPIEIMPSLVDIQLKLDQACRNRLDVVCFKFFQERKITSQSEYQHQAVVQDLQRLICSRFPFGRFDIFGSCKNGFGADGCDIDICFRFAYDLLGENENSKDVKILKKFAQMLRTYPKVRRVTPIIKAKVPIIKLDYIFMDSTRKVVHKCDISLYNILALYNTHLLRVYSQIDSRVQVLGMTVKRFAKVYTLFRFLLIFLSLNFGFFYPFVPFKVCNISDASKGSLSSYAYILMTLHYLQQCNPPVIPVLQELCSSELTETKIDGWNVAHFEDLSRLSSVWPYLNKNKDSVGDLFLGFLRYYSEIFSFDENVVCVRRLKKLTKVEKGWTNRMLAIEGNC